MKILTIIGARPQFIKAAVVSRCIRQSQADIREEIIHTGQHYDFGMSQVFFDEMSIPRPTVNLQVGSGLHGASTGEMLKGIEAEIITRKPDYVLVYGDTNSTLAGALAAAKLHIPIAHIEAGERSYNRVMPEEVNRVLTDHMSTTLFCCSESAKRRLASEGIVNNVQVVGDVMYDAFLMYSSNAVMPKSLTAVAGSYALMTLHRAQNTDDIDRLSSIFSALSIIPDQIILPLHPRTRKSLNQSDITLSKNIHLIEPVSYFEMLWLLNHCAYVITDSGGLQKESYYASKKCVVLREETEWTDLVEVGINYLVGIEKDKICQASLLAKSTTEIPKNIYGTGDSGNRIVKALQYAI